MSFGDLILSQAGILATWILYTLGCLGWGWSVTSRLSVSPQRLFLYSFFTGFAIVLALAELWHFFLPVSRVTAFALIGPGLALLAVHGFLYGKTLRGPALRNMGVQALLTLLCMVPLAHRSLDNIINFDAGLYYLNTLDWLHTYPLVPGLANLHARLGYNNIFLLFSSVLDVGSLNARGYYMATGLVAAPFIGHCGAAMLRALRQRRKLRPLEWLEIALLFAGSLVVQHPWIGLSSPSSDVASGFLNLVAAIAFVEAVSLRAKRLRPFHVLFLLGIFSVAGFTLKLSGIFLCAGFAGMALLRFWRELLPAWPRLLLPLVLISLPLLLHMGRSVVLTGYPLYPIRALRIPFDWQVPKATVVEEARTIAVWARTPGRIDDPRAHTYTEWLSPWWKHFRVQAVLIIPMVLAALLVPFMLVVAIFRVRPFRVSLGGRAWHRATEQAPEALPATEPEEAAAPPSAELWPSPFREPPPAPPPAPVAPLPPRKSRHYGVTFRLALALESGDAPARKFASVPGRYLLLLLAIPVLFALGAWFTNAPDPRFCLGPLGIITAVMVAQMGFTLQRFRFETLTGIAIAAVGIASFGLIGRINADPNASGMVPVIIAAGVLMLGATVVLCFMFPRGLRSAKIGVMCTLALCLSFWQVNIWILKGVPDRSPLAPFPPTTAEPQVLSDGTTVYRITGTTQNWDGPLEAAPYIDPRLIHRGPTPRDGYRIKLEK
ncbi:hypothetical protein DB346_01390 [Verrucomicrobia bacterium LW23]|nr:hypothetical protein DB346_01390 [Verrucomicrobia bacterium LW23]